MAGVNPVPQGMHTLTPNLVLRDCVRAIDFYKRALGAQVEATMRSLPDAVDVRAEPQVQVPQIDITFDRTLAARVGASLQDLQSAVTTAFQGSRVAEVFEGQRLGPRSGRQITQAGG